MEPVTLNPEPTYPAACKIAVILTDELGKLADIPPECLEDYLFSFESDYERRVEFLSDIAAELSRIPFDAFPLYDLCIFACEVIKDPPKGRTEVTQIVQATIKKLQEKGIYL